MSMKIKRQYIEEIFQANSQEQLLPVVQNAIVLEHATIPPYLCGYFTLKLNSNDEVGNIIRSVFVEEMLHLTITCNLMIALGGKPSINHPGFVPDYPHGLPMGIGDNLEVTLKKCSIEHIQKVFMGIEKPEKPLDIKVTAKKLESIPDFETIGQFYQYLAKRIEKLGDSITWHTEHQVVASDWFPDEGEMFEINSVETAVKAINIIIDQGEGSNNIPYDAEGEPAHYYRFQQIVKGKKLINAPGLKPPYAYGGEPIALDMGNVWDMDDNPKIAKYKPGSTSHRLATEFSYSYTKLLNSLHQTFNGEPSKLDHAMGIMYELRLLAQQVLATPAEWADTQKTDEKQTGLSFEYQPLNT